MTYLLMCLQLIKKYMLKYDNIDNFIKMKTLGGRFVLISSDSKKEMFLQWKRMNMNQTADVPATRQMKYMERKNIISQLQPITTRQNLNSQRTNKQQNNVKTSASTNKISPYVYANPQRQNATVSNFYSHQDLHKTLYRSRSMSKGINRVKEGALPQKQINQYQIQQKGIQAAKYKEGKVICILNMRRSGLRYKLSHKFHVWSSSINHKTFINEIKQHFFKGINNKNVYLFHLSKEPINNISNNLDEKEYVIFCDIGPKFNLPFEIQMKLFEQASSLEAIIKQYEFERVSQVEECDNQDSKRQRKILSGYGKQLRRIHIENQIRENNKKKEEYQWEKINNIEEYVDKLIDDPSSKIQPPKVQGEQKDLVENWCNQNFIQQAEMEQKQDNKKPQKNPFFDVHTHYPKQTIEQKGLEATLEKMGLRKQTKNVHEIKHHAIENMMEKIKREKENADRLKKQEEKKIKLIGYKSEKEFMKALDQKNTLLVEQNIPYVMGKYGITRAQAYNLYNLYKSLEKISAMRLFDSNQFRLVEEKGIDRQTFDEGLKALEINPGDEVIRNICYFPEFISWEQFIKIISISLRKTTESKLEAILQGIGSSSSDSLSSQQISIMIGSSLQKIFGRQQPQLKNHFVNVVMKTLDKDNSGLIDSKQLKRHVLQAPLQSLDLISYLILNS